MQFFHQVVPDGGCADNGLVPVERSTLERLNVETGNIQHSTFSVPCSHTLSELFISGTEPRRFDDWHQRIALDRRNGLRAGVGCPLDFVAFQTFTLYPAEAQAWVKKQAIPQPPGAYSPLCPNETQGITNGESANGEMISSAPLPPRSSALLFTSPDQGSTFRLVPNIPVEKQKIRVSIRPTDGVSLRQVRLLINGQPLADGWETLWQMSPGTHTFEAIGIDAAGNEVRANRVTVKVVE
ncbi:MAG: hypothetical protein HC875_37835 [Anaerolineales bacterium]|nr:hypothetical protein [Anaerolineales bacterium]